MPNAEPLRKSERIEARDVQPGDCISLTRYGDPIQVKAIERAGERARVMRLVTGGTIRPLNTVRLWRQRKNAAD